jgi:predicted ATP-binding protein involved in virulence
MRIDHLEVENFKCFPKGSFDFHPSFTLLIGDNGAGKTSVLDALAVALGLWHKVAPGSGWRNILPEEIRLEAVRVGDKTVFHRRLPTRITATGIIGDRAVSWTRMIRKYGTRTTNAEASAGEAAIVALHDAWEQGRAQLPALAYYGAGRAWLPSNRPKAAPSRDKRSPLDAFHNFLDTRIRDRELNDWFLLETAAAGGGEGRAAFRAVKQAVLGCVPGADRVRYDSDLKEIVLSIGGVEQPYYNLSAGQRMMLALVADIALKVVLLNPALVAEADGAGDPTAALRASPGVVLVDELDVHLDPKWQRRVAGDLKRTFPGIQFVCTSHSPQVIGELRPEEIRLLAGEKAFQPPRSFGLDSSRVVEEVQGGSGRNAEIEALIRHVSRLIDAERLDEAKEQLARLVARLGEDDPEVTRARALMALLEGTGA